ncbi:iron chelate uptake ABC transporter family permease subunit [Campylobacter sp. RM6883]|uniref:Iron chelate uptake ABC transporter family permease subunit n=1 Tax=Campylobacter californiensis TaxID=1032243 RepID=A0AAW3ZYB6_9BACT|nr:MULTISPECIES: iron chelate uptake ABC transporter family permease subunit [unclassified Campylobacter]MBE2985219.1 iron chelate uptake ABC transporter family permease subunit [Campylobacter sp. RM6883]MBE2995296.1 iron chelate uptake ABC transporter family permease subunit [Campylobacter sp. RM6913]MBE3608290.1 iron chelate uptake ABC transporter family permease subunit [Campylobacter sp. RM9337]QCD51545.1 ferric enterobactin ABC transporter CeuBCDE, permease protein [Campylobacter sp. RM691
MKALAHKKRILILVLATMIFWAFYLFYDINFKFFEYYMSIRLPKLGAILITAFCIGAATLVFQTIINNTIVTPCLLGMNSLYLVIHTTIVFFLGSTSVFASNKYISFFCDLVLMGTMATIIYSYLFRVTKFNVLYVLLAGTVMATFFLSLQSTMVRIMDPNEYETLLATLVASFSHVNADILGIAFILVVFLTLFYKKELEVLDVIALGKERAINLGVDYDRVISKLLLGVTLFIAIATALVGPISFLGLIIANLARQILKTYKHSYLTLAAALVGMIVLVCGQLIVERIFDLAIPISVFVNIAGGIYFLYLLLANKGNQ